MNGNDIRRVYLRVTQTRIGLGGLVAMFKWFRLVSYDAILILTCSGQGTLHNEIGNMTEGSKEHLWRFLGMDHNDIIGFEPC